MPYESQDRFYPLISMDYVYLWGVHELDELISSTDELRQVKGWDAKLLKGCPKEDSICGTLSQVTHTGDTYCLLRPYLKAPTNPDPTVNALALAYLIRRNRPSVISPASGGTTAEALAVDRIGLALEAGQSKLNGLIKTLEEKAPKGEALSLSWNLQPTWCRYPKQLLEEGVFRQQAPAGSIPRVYWEGLHSSPNISWDSRVRENTLASGRETCLTLVMPEGRVDDLYSQKGESGKFLIASQAVRVVAWVEDLPEVVRKFALKVTKEVCRTDPSLLSREERNLLSQVKGVLPDLSKASALLGDALDLANPLCISRIREVLSQVFCWGAGGFLHQVFEAARRYFQDYGDEVSMLAQVYGGPHQAALWLLERAVAEVGVRESRP